MTKAVKAPGGDEDEFGITELVEFDPTRLDGVKSAATGLGFLIMKSVAAKGTRDCECGKAYDEDTKAANCEDCGKKLPMPAKKASEPECKTCKDTGTIMDGNRDCPDCDAKPKAGKSAAEKAQIYAAAGKINDARRVLNGNDAPETAFGHITKTLAKAAEADGTIDEGPDVDLGHKIMGLLAQAIINEAQEIGAGMYGETCDVDLLNSAAGLIRMWIGRESAPDEGAPMGMLMDSAAVKAAVREMVADELAKDSRNFSTDEREKQADKGNALPDGSYPIPDADALGRAATLAQSKHGDWQAAEKLIARRASELGVANPLDGKGDASKGAVAEGETGVDTEAQGTSSLSKAVEDALTKALEPFKADLAGLQAFKAKVEATPVPGGPVTAVARQTRTEDRTDWAAKAAQYRETAAQMSDPETREGYLQKAREFDAKALSQS